MCGFAGEFLFCNDRPGGSAGRADVAVARRMAAAVSHRGPDEQGEFVSEDGRCAMAFHRLAVIDVAGSHQPMTSADGRLTVAFNGEIYNYQDLRRDLAADGVLLRTAGDTEVLLHLYRCYGVDLLARLEGMFAFALYDASAGALLLARDRLGQKPLWYARLADRLVFASEAPALLRHPRVSKEFGAPSLCIYMTMGYVPAPHSIWSNVSKLPPGHRMTVAQECEGPCLYWSPQPVRLPELPGARVAAVRGAVQTAVEARLHAEVPLGALLSGGLDSSIIVALMARASRDPQQVRTFTAGFEGAGLYDETEAARRTAAHLGTKHTEIVVQPAPASAVDAMVRMYGEPFADSSALPTWLVCKAAREHVTVALVGDGGDEAFGGYDRYRAMHLAESMSPPKYLAIRLAAFFLRAFAPHEERSRLRRLVRFADALPLPPPEQYFRYRRLFAPAELRRLFTEEFLEALDTEAVAQWFWRLYEASDCRDEVEHAQRHDVATYLPDDLLVKADLASMSVGLELRAPFLDHRVVSLGLSLPADLKVRRGRGKAILREAFGELLPAHVLAAPKRGFGVPLGAWLRGELFETLRETLMDPWLHARGIFRPEALAGLLNDHFDRRGDYGHLLWALLVFARWLSMAERNV